MTDFFLDLTESCAPGGVVGVPDGVARGHELVGEGQAHLEGRARVAEADYEGLNKECIILSALRIIIEPFSQNLVIFESKHQAS